MQFSDPPLTAHTTNPVPFIIVNADPAYTLREGGCLADIVPTLIEMMGMKQPEEMTGKYRILHMRSSGALSHKLPRPWDLTGKRDLTLPMYVSLIMILRFQTRKWHSIRFQ
mgnify:CR=1 FL=1